MTSVEHFNAVPIQSETSRLYGEARAAHRKWLASGEDSDRVEYAKALAWYGRATRNKGMLDWSEKLLNGSWRAKAVS